MMLGTIKKIVSERGFAFVHGEDDQDYFLWCKEIGDDFDTLNVGDLIRFTPTSTPKGLRATRAAAVKAAV